VLKITSQLDPVKQDMVLVLEGRLAGPWVEELRTYCRRVVETDRWCTMIDLTGVTFVDAEGKALLAQLWQQGVELRASGCLTRCLVEDIRKVGRTTCGGSHGNKRSS
jgi:anti-anti-sigma regulatory factor